MKFNFECLMYAAIGVTGAICVILAINELVKIL